MPIPQTSLSCSYSVSLMTSIVLPPLAVLAGVLSVTTPCCLPMIPSYLSYVSSAGAGRGGADGGSRQAALRASLVFVAGFGIVFTALGASLGLVGPVIVRMLPEAERIAGVFVIAIGLHLAGLLRWPASLRRGHRATPRARRGVDGFLLGVAFAVGFVPTLGPVLGTVLTLAGGNGTVLWGATLLALYSVGFGIPFVAMSLGLERASRSISLLQRHLRRLQVAGGLLLVGVGFLFVTGVWRTFFIPIAAWLSRLGWPPL